MIYMCRRSATVISQNYNTFARIHRPRFRELISEFPEYEACLKRHIKEEYKDAKIEFLKNMVRSVDYLKNCSEDLIYDIVFSLQLENFEKDSIVLQTNNQADKIYFIEEGQVELYTSFEGNEFVIERLDRGSVINHRAFFIQDNMYVNIRCKVESKLLSLTQENMRQIIQKYESESVGRNLLIYQNKILKQERKYPLDYISQPLNPKLVADPALREKKDKHRNSIKNVIMRIVVEIRERKEKPKLSDLIAASKQQQQFKDMKQWKDKVIQLYTDNPQQTSSKKDENFNKLMESFNRVHQSLSQQQDSLSNLIK